MINFEKGKWYKGFTCSLIYAKCSETVAIDGPKFKYSEWIHNNEHDYITGSFCIPVRYPEEVSLEEIQKFLPDNHPDKVFVLPEKWYVKGSNKKCSELTTEDPELSKLLQKQFTNVSRIGFHTFFYYYIVHNEHLLRFSRSIPEGYTEITFEIFKKYVLKQEKEEVMEKKIYVKIINEGKNYTTHCNAREYGMTNYFYWTKNAPVIKENSIYKVVKEVTVNGDDPSYILVDEKTGYEYLISKRGCEIIDKPMEKKIIGYKTPYDLFNGVIKKGSIYEGETVLTPKHKDCPYDIAPIQYQLPKEIVKTWEPVYEDEFKVGDYIYFNNQIETCSPKGSVGLITHVSKEDRPWISYTTNLGKGGFEIEAYTKKGSFRLATKEEIQRAQVKELYFGKVKFTIRKGCDYAETEYGRVTKEEIAKAIDWLINPPKLAGYTFKIHNLSTDQYVLLSELTDKHAMSIGFGCKHGTMDQLRSIYQAFEV